MVTLFLHYGHHIGNIYCFFCFFCLCDLSSTSLNSQKHCNGLSDSKDPNHAFKSFFIYLFTLTKYVDDKWWNRELTLKCKLKCYVKPMKDPLGVSPSKGNQGATRGKEKFLLTSVGIEPTTSGLNLPLLCRLSYEVGQTKSGTI